MGTKRTRRYLVTCADASVPDRTHWRVMISSRGMSSHIPASWYAAKEVPLIEVALFLFPHVNFYQPERIRKAKKQLRYQVSSVIRLI